MSKLAQDLRIGQPFGRSKSRDADRPRIKTLSELCVERPTPHVHVVTSEGATCLAFRAPVQ